MGKILIRIYPNQFGEKLPLLSENSVLDVILLTGAVIHGQLVSFDGNTITIRHNHYRRQHAMKLSEISEIVVDQEITSC